MAVALRAVSRRHPLGVIVAGLLALSACEDRGQDAGQEPSASLRPFSQGQVSRTPQEPALDGRARALALAAEGAGGRAVEAARRWWVQNPDDEEIRDLLIDLYSAQRRYTELAAFLQNLVASGNTESEIHRKLGSAYASTGDIRQAEAALMRAVELDPQNLAAYNNLAAVRARDSNVGGAIAALEKVIGLDSTYTMALGNLGRAYAEAGEHDKAETTLRRLLALEPQNQGAKRQLGGVLNDLGRFGEASEVLEESLRREASAAGHFELARSYEGEDRPELAVAHLQRATQIDPTYTDALYRLGQLCSRSGDEACARQALDRFSTWREVAREQPALWRRIQYHKQALEADPADDQAHYELGQIYLRQGWLAVAATELASAVAANEDFLEAWRGLGTVYVQQDRMREAAGIYETMVKKWPQDLGAWNNLCISYTQVGVLDAALKACEHALSMGPEKAGLHYNLGNLYWRRGEPEHALGAYRRALSRDPGNRRLREAVARMERVLRPGASQGDPP